MTDIQELKELLPCPWCGGRAMSTHSTDNHGKWWRTGCYDANCLAEEDYERDDNCKVAPSTGQYRDRNISVKIWNTRTCKQLTTTQQALDSSCETNKVLVKRLKIADEALENIVRREQERVDSEVRKNPRVIADVTILRWAQKALTSIKE